MVGESMPVQAIREQAERLCYIANAWGAEPRARLAELLLAKSGFTGGGRVLHPGVARETDQAGSGRGAERRHRRRAPR